MGSCSKGSLDWEHEVPEHNLVRTVFANRPMAWAHSDHSRSESDTRGIQTMADTRCTQRDLSGLALKGPCCSPCCCTGSLGTAVLVHLVWLRLHL